MSTAGQITTIEELVFEGEVGVRRLHIGGEEARPGWEIFNIQDAPEVDHLGDAADLSQFPDETFKVIYASHILEHFDYSKTLKIALQEWHRVLTPDGRLLVSVPDLERLGVMVGDKERLSLQDRIDAMRMIMGGHMNPYDYHHTGFTLDILAGILGEVGFQKMIRVEHLGLFPDIPRPFLVESASA